MASNYKRFRSRVGITLINLILLLSTNFSDACNPFKSAGSQAAEKLSGAMRETSAQLSATMTASTSKLTANINQAVARLETLGKAVSGELGLTIRQASKDLTNVGLKLTESLDKGVTEVSSVLREGIDAAKDITDMLARSVDKAVIEVGDQIENAVNGVREVVNTLAKSIDNGVEEMGKSLRYMADKMVEISKQININIDSKDMVQVADAAHKALVQSIKTLTENWEVAINTADLKDVGLGAAQELRKALENINADVKVTYGVDYNLRISILYVCVALCVCFISVVISVKGSKDCACKIFDCCRRNKNPAANAVGADIYDSDSDREGTTFRKNDGRRGWQSVDQPRKLNKSYLP